MKKTIQLSLILALLLTGCSNTTKEETKEITDLPAYFQEIVENTLDYSHSLAIQVKTKDEEYSYFQYLSDGKEDLGAISYELDYFDPDISISDYLLVSNATLMIPNSDHSYDQYNLNDYDMDHWSYYDTIDDNFNRNEYFDLTAYTNLSMDQIKLDEENSYYKDNTLHLVYIDNEDNKVDASGLKDLTLDIEVESDMIQEMNVTTKFSGEHNDVTILVKEIDDIGDTYYKQQVEEAYDYSNRPIAETEFLFWFDYFTDLDQDTYDLVKTIDEAYLKTTSSNYTMITEMTDSESLICDDSINIDYYYAIEDNWSKEIEFSFAYNDHELYDFLVQMPPLQIERGEGEYYHYAYAPKWYWTDSSRDYIITDSNDLYPEDYTGGLNVCQSLELTQTSQMDYKAVVVISNTTKDGQSIYELQDDYAIYTFTVDDQGYIVSKVIDAGEYGITTIQYIHDVPDYDTTYEQIKSTLNTNVLENEYLNDLINQYKK